MRSKINKRYGGSVGGKQTKRKSHKYLGKKHRATKRAYRRRHKRVKSIRAKSRRGQRRGGVGKSRRKKKRTEAARRSAAAARPSPPSVARPVRTTPHGSHSLQVMDHSGRGRLRLCGSSALEDYHAQISRRSRHRPTERAPSQDAMDVARPGRDEERWLYMLREGRVTQEEYDQMIRADNNFYSQMEAVPIEEEREDIDSDDE